MTMSGLLELNQLFTGKDEADTLFTCTYRSGLTLCGLMTPASRVSAVTKHPHHLMCLLSVETDQKGAMQSCPTYLQLISMRFYTHMAIRRCPDLLCASTRAFWSPFFSSALTAL